ncbi:hypothetical protein C1H46_007494 [Malus baccata]|uniref:NAB domain-containing protein n=1 Tax=Malus baccata TaxID=106549 RepID=A0A540N734_MALBA|nr:hypothetical protein C1H46_007494 [Malus baccata]
MLHRAASNAYSWWWASHIRTKQSKWLEQSLQDMEEKVHDTLKIIDEDGDSFAKRAEMYYRKRPELVAYVEESFRAYRALAERYDHLSRDLQSANRTIATVFPERVQYAMEDEDDEIASQTSTSSDGPNKVSPDASKNIPKVPKAPKYLRSKSTLLSRKGTLKRNASSTKAALAATLRSGLTKEEALGEIDKLQKDILALQTEKEFVKVFFERGYDRYWEFENQITDMQKRVCKLQDEYGIGTVIEDNEARTLMAATALKSCKDSLTNLQDKKERSEEDARVERQRVREACSKFESLRNEFRSKHTDWCDTDEYDYENIDVESISLDQEIHDDQDSLRSRVLEQLDTNSNTSISMTELAEKIDRLVNKIVNLETAVTSQNALVNRLKSENDELQAHTRSLEEEKETLMENADKMSKRLKELEEELRRIRNLNRKVEDQNNDIQTHFTEASCNLYHLSGKLNSVKHEEEDENAGLFQDVKAVDAKREKEIKEDSNKAVLDDDLAVLEDKMSEGEIKKKNVTILETSIKEEDEEEKQSDQPMQHEQGEAQDLSEDVDPQELELEKEEQPNWRQLFLKGLEDREKVLLEEYTSILRDYKDARRKLGEVEKKNRDNIFDLAMEIRELRGAVASKDKEIKHLKQKLGSPETNPEDSPATVYKFPTQEGPLESPTQVVASPYSTVSSPNLDKEMISSYLGEQGTEKFEDSSGNLKVLPRKEEERIMRRRHTVRPHSVSAIEGRFRSDIDELLEENLEFWLRFSTSVHQIQKFHTSIQDLQSELLKLKNKKKHDGRALQSDARPIYRHLREIQTELSLWLEHNAVLKDDLQGRLSSLCHIQDEISRLSSLSSEGENMELISKYQAAKFQGEVLNMKQENNKVADELQAGLNRVDGLKVEVEKTLARLDGELGISVSKSINNPKRSTSKSRIPLRSFLFGVKLRRQRPSIFSCASPSLQKQHSDLGAAALPPEQPM